MSVQSTKQHRYKSKSVLTLLRDVRIEGTSGLETLVEGASEFSLRSDVVNHLYRLVLIDPCGVTTNKDEGSVDRLVLVYSMRDVEGCSCYAVRGCFL